MKLSKKQLLTAAAMALLLFAGTRVYAQQAQTPSPSVNTISYQGSIVEMDGSAVKDSIYPITVSIWTDATQGTRLWRDVFQTEVKGGIFNILLGSQIPLPSPASMDKPLWLNVSFNTDLENLPRFALGTVPSAMNVADSAITSAKIANGAVQSASIADSAVTSVKLAAGAVQSANLADSAVTGAKMATDYVSAVTINGTQVTSRGGVLNLASGDGVQFTFDSASNSVHANVPLAQQSLPGDDHWGEHGNFNITVPNQFVGTIDSSSALEIHLEDGSMGMSTPDNVRIAHYQFDATSPSITSGFGAGSLTGNIIGDAATSPSTVRFHGSTIAGGGAAGLVNTISGRGNFDFIGSGVANTIKSAYSALSGGDSNYVDTLVDFSYIGGGLKNKIGWYGYSEQQIEQPLGDTSYLGGDFIGAGASDTVKTALASIVGGFDNLIDTFASYSFIGGGEHNLITNPPELTSFSAIVAGSGNIVSNEGSIVGSGGSNIVASVDAGIITGLENHDSATDAVVGGGIQNVITPNAGASFVGDGTFNWTNSVGTFIGAGLSDSINAFGSGAVSGQYAKIDTESYYSFVGAGSYSLIDTNSPYSVIGGGNLDVIDIGSPYSVIAGGDSNHIDVSAGNTFIGGGSFNYAGGTGDVIAGGDTNTIDQGNGESGVVDYSSILGGNLNQIEPEIVGADHPTEYSSIAGGYLNTTKERASFIGGGESNQAVKGWAVVLGGDSNINLSLFSAVGGGQHNVIGSINPWSGIWSGLSNFIGSEFSVIAGGDTNVINETGPLPTHSAMNSFIGGGDHNLIRSDWDAIAGGHGNLIDSLADHSFIGGGETNSIDPSDDHCGIDGGQNNIIDTLVHHSFIGGGEANNIKSVWDVIGGGDTNQIGIVDSFATIAGGLQNFMVPTNAPYAAIPGGDSLTANSFAQTVMGYNNVVSGTFVHGTPHTFSTLSGGIQDQPLVIVGNGDNGTHQSNAFQLSYDGHTTVFDINNNGIGGRAAILGSTYQDNVIYAWGDITGAAGIGLCVGSVTDNADFGVLSVTYICTGHYRVQLNTKDATGATFTAWSDLSVTATPMSATPSAAATCVIAVVSPVGVGSIPNAFDIFLLNPESGCAPVDGRVSFHVCGRP